MISRLIVTTVSRLTLLVAVLLACRTAVAADARRDIRELEARLDRAVVEGDVATFDRLFAADFTHGSQSGRFRTKTEWLQGKEQGTSAYVSFDAQDVQVRVAGETAIVTGLSKPRWREAGGIASGQFRYLRVWAKRNGDWQVVAFQSTKVPSESKQPTAEQALDIDDPPATREFSIQDDLVPIFGLQRPNVKKVD